MAKNKRANVEGVLSGEDQTVPQPKTRAANKVTIELSPKVVSILKQGSAELGVKMPDLIRRLAESPLIERAADDLLEGIAKQALAKLSKWVSEPVVSGPNPAEREIVDDPSGMYGEAAP